MEELSDNSKKTCLSKSTAEPGNPTSVAETSRSLDANTHLKEYLAIHKNKGYFLPQTKCE